MRRSRSAAFALSIAWGFALAPVPVRAMELEQAGKWREALVAFRAALDESLTASILGIERVYDQLGKRDSIVPLIDTLIARRPRESMLRTIQLRTLGYLHRDEAAA